MSAWNVFFAVLMLAVPAYFFWRFCPRLLTKAAMAVARMAAQLALVAFYLYWLFRVDSVVVNLIWLALMSVVGAFSVCSRAHLRNGVMAVPLVAGQVVAVIVVGLYLLLLVFHTAHPLSARWFVPVAGILLCEAQLACAVALRDYYSGLRRDNQMYDLLLGNGATHLEAVTPYLRHAVEKTFTPILANMAVVGLVVYPELTYGQMLGGFSPLGAVIVTAIIIVASLTVSVVSLIATLFLADRRAFDAYGHLRQVETKVDAGQEP